MNAFEDVSLPLPFALGASGGPQRRVDIVALGSGREVRNTPWAHGRRSYDVGSAVRTLDDMHALIAFFEARRGKLVGFRFRDPFDCKSCAPSQALAHDDQELGVGDGVKTAFQLVRTYGAGESAYTRPIKKPVAVTVRVAVGGVEVSAGDFEVDDLGVVMLTTPPAIGVLVTAGFVFDTPVRFDMDRLDLALDGFGAGHALTVPLTEILL
ncbi:MAG: DUF2460 domain-containing protein [Proteobacteria bacterium]|nr:DUF2460 domain-containing protein [Pseudomonadota bacterium]